MTAISTRRLRTGRSPVITADDQLVMGDGPDIYGHVLRHRLHCHWQITEGPYGAELAEGRTWTKGGAWVEAIAAAHRPGIGSGR